MRDIALFFRLKNVETVTLSKYIKDTFQSRFVTIDLYTFKIFYETYVKIVN